MEQSTSNQYYVSPFLSDPQFQQGLESILAPLRSRNASEEEIEEVTKRAETFFAQSRISAATESGNISNTATFNTHEPTESSTIAFAPSTTLPTASTSTSSDAPPYPLSFASLASLIASGAPIPGIREIPNKLASEEPSISTIEIGKVKKPWER